MDVTSDRRFRFPAEVDAVWSQLCDVPGYPRWWPWLTEFDGRALEPGAVWRCGVRSPLRIMLRFELRIDHVVELLEVAATLDGDLRGSARFDLSPLPAGSQLRLVSRLAPRHQALGMTTSLVPPLARWAHDRLIDTAAGQFSRSLPAR